MGTQRRSAPPNLAPIESSLSWLGMPGLTAYFGLLDVGRPRRGETARAPIPRASLCTSPARRPVKLIAPRGSYPQYACSCRKAAAPERQYSSASMMVMTRSVTDGSDGSGE